MSVFFTPRPSLFSLSSLPAPVLWLTESFCPAFPAFTQLFDRRQLLLNFEVSRYFGQPFSGSRHFPSHILTNPPNLTVHYIFPPLSCPFCVLNPPVHLSISGDSGLALRSLSPLFSSSLTPPMILPALNLRLPPLSYWCFLFYPFMISYYPRLPPAFSLALTACQCRPFPS